MRHFATILAAFATPISCGGTPSKSGEPQAVEHPVAPQFYTYQVVAEYPHSRTSYTQGLQFIDGELWEGTGEYGESKLLRTDLTTGKALKSKNLPKNEFGEGITVLGDKIYQLTWLNGTMHVYERESLKPIAHHTYNGEGWGLTSDGTKLYMSDGTSNIRILNPDNCKVERYIGVTLNGESVQYLNELEWIDGKIWANVYTTDYVVIIDPKTGVVEGVIDFRGLSSQIEVKEDTDVFNGIAYDAATKRIFVTGKLWNKLFEVELVKR